MNATRIKYLLDYSGVVVFLVLCIACLAHTVPKIEQDVRKRANQEISLFRWASVHVDGNTVYLRGSVRMAGEQGWALKRLRGVAGVRRVVDQTELAPPAH